MLSRGRDTQGGVVMEARPTSALVMRKTELLLEFLVVSFNASAHLGDEGQLLCGSVGGSRRKKVLGRLGATLGPFD